MVTNNMNCQQTLSNGGWLAMSVLHLAPASRSSFTAEHPLSSPIILELPFDKMSKSEVIKYKISSLARIQVTRSRFSNSAEVLPSSCHSKCYLDVEHFSI